MLFTTTAPCPYCYTEINPRKLAYRCSGRHAAGRTPCEKKADPARGRHFNDTNGYWPVIGSEKPGKLLGGVPKPGLSGNCENCGSEPGPPVCPECHSLLPSEYGADSALFGMVGVRGAGKTVMLSILDAELQTSVADRFDAAIDAPGGKSGLTRDLRVYHQLMSEGSGTVPGQTQENRTGRKEPAVYSWRYTKKGPLGTSRTASTVFSFYDNAGEDFATTDAAMTQRYLGATSGVILLLDPFGFPENHKRAVDKGAGYMETGPEEVIDAITAVLRATGNVKRTKKIKQPIAVVVSKIDAFFDQIEEDHPLRSPSSKRPVFDESEGQTVHDHVGLLIQQWGGAGLLRKLEHNYTSFRLFGASALGAEPDYASQRVNQRGLLPHRIAEPLLWLMAMRGFLPSTGA
ncbi:hypothetical protein [Nocardiopsis sp. L17-MgMaSL7]|uniref:hypothetical protein n=1 Tax=Nocardiopsis sp. L17-MgMaSL7 TaxID=1938893 RepID=UPI000D717DD9|nr:hypothetical protein [Nocardiopsis sp. L17-MgMaSL7]PWV50025.1 hypothetical protein BDW27_10860 [Nocardiopsis sp. L17-MgMaSL7]